MQSLGHVWSRRKVGWEAPKEGGAAPCTAGNFRDGVEGGEIDPWLPPSQRISSICGGENGQETCSV